MSEAKKLDEVKEVQDAGVEEESFKQLFEASLKEQTEIRRGEMVDGMVVSLNSDAVIIDIIIILQCPDPITRTLKAF